MKVYYENDADLNLLKDKTVAIIGYGSQATPTHRTFVIPVLKLL